MGVKFGEIDVSQILENEFRLGVLERILEQLVKLNPEIINLPQDKLDNIRQSVIKDLKKKYPNSGIEYRSSK